MKELNDDEIRIIGGEQNPSPSGKKSLVRIGIVVLIAVVAALIVLWVARWQASDAADKVLFDSTTVAETVQSQAIAPINAADSVVGITVSDTTVNDIPLTIFVPHRLRPALWVGPLPVGGADSIVMALQAADLRADNMEIVSAFVRQGRILSRGVAKQGYCAIIDGKITMGVGESTASFEQAVDMDGDFFRQYPLVADGVLVENRVKNKAQRRALAMISGRVVVVTTHSRESLHDFSQALVDVGAQVAINLVGSTMASGWINTVDSVVSPTSPIAGPIPPMINYIIWTK